MVRQRPAKPCPFLGSAGSIPALSAHSTIHYSLPTTHYSLISVLVAQRIEHRPAEPEMEVRFLPRTPNRYKVRHCNKSYEIAYIEKEQGPTLFSFKFCLCFLKRVC